MIGGASATRLAAIALSAALLVACAPVPPGEIPQRRVPAAEAVPPTPQFGSYRPAPPQRANAEIAQDFLELAFRMESGREIARLSRFEEPVRLRLAGTVPADAEAETGRILDRLRREAGLDVSMAAADGNAGITVEFVPRDALHAAVPNASCFIVPNVSGWEEFRRKRRSGNLDWTTLERRERVAVFLPFDVPPQERRDCLHEEIAQAMGPLNDMYRLHESVFNDDNFQTVLTGFDMLILRAFNAPELRSGMTREQVADRLPALLARLNPRGERIAPAPERIDPSPRAWIDAIERALGSSSASRSQRRAAAEAALRIAQDRGWEGSRLAFSWFTLGRLARSSEAELALNAFLRAGRIYASLPGGEVHVAHVDMQIAAFALSAGRYEDALRIATGRAQAAARASHNAALLASLQMVRAEAMERLGRHDAAREVRLDSLAWARYGFGSDDEVRGRVAEIAALAPPMSGDRLGG